ncbi:MAG: outer membrane beta-barrel protein [Bacteroidota bacterium]
MKKIIFLTMGFLMTFNIYAQNNTTEDTLKLKWKDSRIWIFSDKVKTDSVKTDSVTAIKEKEKKDKKKGNFTHWRGIDIGICALSTANNQFNIPDEDAYNLNYFLNLKYNRSWYFSLNFIEKNFRLYKNYINLITGLGIEWNSYNFKNNIILNPYAGNTSSSTVKLDTADNISYIKNQIKTTYIKIPLLFEFNTNPTNANKSFHLAGGMEFGYKINSLTNRKFKKDGYTTKEKIYDDYNLNVLKYAIVIRAGYGNFTLFTNYSLSSLFIEDKGPERILYPLSIGVALSF